MNKVNSSVNGPVDEQDVKIKLDYPKVEGGYFSCWAESHGNRVAQIFIPRRKLGDVNPRCRICEAVMTYGRYTDQVDTGIVMIDPKTGIVMEAKRVTVDIDKAPDLLAFDASEDHRRKLRKWLDGRKRPFEVLLEKEHGDRWVVHLSYAYKRESAAWNRYARLMIWAHANKEVSPKLVRDFVEYQREGGEFDLAMYVEAIREQEDK